MRPERDGSSAAFQKNLTNSLFLYLMAGCSKVWGQQLKKLGPTGGSEVFGDN